MLDKNYRDEKKNYQRPRDKFTFYQFYPKRISLVYSSQNPMSNRFKTAEALHKT